MTEIFSSEYWKRLLGHAGTEWPELTEEDMRHSEAGRDALTGRVRERYALSEEEAHQRVGEWIVRAQQRV